MRPEPYTPNSIISVDWSGRSPDLHIIFVGTETQAMAVLRTLPAERLLQYMRFSLFHRAEDRAFWCFTALLDSDATNEEVVMFMEEHPPLVYSALKRFVTVTEESITTLVTGREDLATHIIHNAIRCANELGIATLAALERLNHYIAGLDMAAYFAILWSASLAVRSQNLVQEILLVLSDSRLHTSSLQIYAHKHGLATVFDRAEDAFDTCPCDDGGRPKRQRISPISAKLEDASKKETPSPDQASSAVPPTLDMENLPPQPSAVKANIRVDVSTPIRVHSHVRLQVASRPEHSTLPGAIVDATVTRASRGELYLSVQHPLPPEYANVTWRVYNAGSIATSKAMLDAVQCLAAEGNDCCRFSSIIAGAETPATHPVEETELGLEDDTSSSLNASQQLAVRCVGIGRMTLIWGPPGTLLIYSVIPLLTTQAFRNRKNDRSCTNHTAFTARGS